MKRGKKIGFWYSTSVVVGNMMGAGIFLLPVSLASYGGIGILGWICASAGAILLSFLFGALSKEAPDTIGGPYVFSRIGLGDFAGFLVAWGYWIAIWATNAAIAVALVGYLEVFIPALSHPLAAIGTGLGFIWAFTWINSRPLRTVVQVQLITTILKVIPIFLLGVVGIFFIDWDYFLPFNLSEESTLSAITSTTTLTLFAYLGMESAGIISAETEDAARTVNKSTVVGTSIAVVIYLTSAIAVAGLVSPDELIHSSAPFADAAYAFLGDTAKYVVAGCAVIATMGALNGWILLQGRIPQAAAQDNLFPALFGQVNKSSSPIIGIIISSILASLLMMINYSKSLAETFTFMITLSTLSCLIPYLFSSASYIIIQFNKGHTAMTKMMWVAILSFCFCIWVTIGCGQEIVFYGFLLLLAGMPFYVWLKRKSVDR